MAGASASIGGNGLQSAIRHEAKNFQYYGLAHQHAELTSPATAPFTGPFTPRRPTSISKAVAKQTDDDFTGASITKTTTMAGNFRFHGDEASGLSPLLFAGYDAMSWKELVNPL